MNRKPSSHHPSTAPDRTLAASLIGTSVAALVLSAWLSFLALTLPLDISALPLVTLPLLFALSTFLHTGLFITGHDAMHGTIAPRWPRINRTIGQLATAAYALFPFRHLLRQHHRHHRRPGTDDDPDFHDPKHPGFLRWYIRFIRHYLRWWQVIALAAIFNLLHHGGGLDLANLLLFWVGPVLTSTVQLFTFGTWLPHRHARAPLDATHHARSINYPTWLSFLTCYHFGYHLEHHQHPAVPWWRLPSIRRDRGEPCATTTQHTHHHENRADSAPSL